MGAALAIARPKPNLANVILAWGVQMTQSFLGFEQHLSQISVDLRNRRAEIQKLKDLIRAAEASKRSRSVRRSTIALAGRASSSQLVLTAD